jgi:hypothetical protein
MGFEMSVDLKIEPVDRYNWALVESKVIDTETANKGKRVEVNRKYFSTLDACAKHAVDLGLRVGGLDALLAQRDDILKGFGLVY